MHKRAAALALAAIGSSLLFARAAEPARPGIGKPQIFKESDLRPGMKGIAWTVFSGNDPEPVPIEILGIERNMWGPKQDVILARMGGKAERTNVAGGMSGSPVYIDGKLVGAVALRLSVFSPDAICGITPIELMLDVNSYDDTKPADARTPDLKKPVNRASVQAAGGLLQQVLAANSAPGANFPSLTPIDTPLTFSGFSQNALQQFAPVFQQMGMVAVEGGGSSSLPLDAKPGPDWRTALKPGDAVTGVLVSGDMSVSGMCTVTYNDGQHVLACGHSFFNLGPVDMPMAKGEVITTLASTYQPNKIGNATEIVGALHQDRHSAILGDLGATAEMVPVTVRVRSYDQKNVLRKQHDLRFSVFVQQKWTPYLMMLTLFNSVSSLNDFAEEATYRLSGNIQLDGKQSLTLSTMQAPSELPVPAPMLLAGWWGDKFNRLFLNPVEMPKLKSVNVTVDLLPERRTATIQNAWISNNEVEAGSVVPVKVFLRPYRGERIEREIQVKIPVGLSKGDHTILLSDAETLNRMQDRAETAEHFMDIPQTVSLINQERSNDRLYVSVIQPRPTVYYEDKALPSLPASVINVMETGRTASHRLISSPESAMEQASIPFDMAISGSYSLKIRVR
ncbi:MAG TPA: hypothetical protein VN610_02535 [Bryobacteraceae bacterium]|nr:hypothetical protein [Bryobacteraceae bacterium]